MIYLVRYFQPFVPGKEFLNDGILCEKRADVASGNRAVMGALQSQEGELRSPPGKCQVVAQGEGDGKRVLKTIHCGRKGGDSPSRGASDRE